MQEHKDLEGSIDFPLISEKRLRKALDVSQFFIRTLREKQGLKRYYLGCTPVYRVKDVEKLLSEMPKK